MTKQEFLAFSLPYGLKYKYLNGTFSLFDTECYKKVIKCDANYSIILHPLSDLTKPIEHNGVMFVPIDILDSGHKSLISYPKIPFRYRGSVGFRYGCTTYHILYDDMSLNSFGKIQKLIEWHFDIANLIEKGEAIDVNTLETNPYE